MASSLFSITLKNRSARIITQGKLLLRHYSGAFRENHGYVPTLSPPQVTSLLTVNEAEVDTKVKGHYPVSGFVSNQLASNSPIEDRRAAAKLELSDASLFAVIDGHGGSACAQAAMERLFDYIAVSLLSYEQLVEFNHCLKTDMPMELLERVAFPSEFTSEELISQYRASLHKYVVETLSLSGLEDPEYGVYDAFRSAFLRLDNDMSHEAMPASGAIQEDLLEVAMSGACANVAHISGLDIHVANTGDCRSVLGSFEPESEGWIATAISSDHNSENKAEVERLRKSHPVSESSFLLKSNRLLGQLIPLRAFGDIRYKWPVKDLKHLVHLMDSPYAQSIIPMNYYTPPYLISEPEITHHRLTPKDKFLVIATDGLWEMLSNTEVVSLVGKHLVAAQTQDKFVLKNQGAKQIGSINKALVHRKVGLAHKNTCVDNNSATHLIRHALGYEHRLVSEMLTFPPYISRHYRDDITVIVVYFDSDYITKNTII